VNSSQQLTVMIIKTVQNVYPYSLGRFEPGSYNISVDFVDRRCRHRFTVSRLRSPRSRGRGETPP